MMKYLVPVVFSLLGGGLLGCAGCERTPIHHPEGGGGLGGVAGGSLGGAAGGSLGGAAGGAMFYSCSEACAHLRKLKCPAADETGGVSCETLCNEVPSLRESTRCTATAPSCDAADACASGETP